MGPHIPLEVKGFGKLGKFCRAILKIAKAALIQSIIIENLPSGSTAPPSAEVKILDSGTLIKLKIGSGGGSFIHPFHLKDASNAIDGTQVRVYFGTVNGVIPEDMTTGDDPIFIIPVTGEGAIWLEVLVDVDGAVDVVTIDAGTETPPDDSDADLFYLTIGTFIVDGDIVLVSDSLSGSQTFSRCRDWFSSPVTYSATWSVV